MDAHDVYLDLVTSRFFVDVGFPGLLSGRGTTEKRPGAKSRSQGDGRELRGPWIDATTDVRGLGARREKWTHTSGASIWFDARAREDLGHLPGAVSSSRFASVDGPGAQNRETKKSRPNRFD